MNEEQNKDLVTVFKIVTVIVMLVNAIRFLGLFFGGFFGVFSSFASFRYSLLAGLFSILFQALRMVRGAVFLAMGLVAYFMFRKPIAENSKKLYITFAGLGIASVLISFIGMFIQLIKLASIGARASLKGTDFGATFLYAAIELAVMYGMYMLLKINPIAGLNGENIKDEVVSSAKDVFEMAKNEFTGRKRMDNENMNVNNGPVETVNPENAEVIAPPPVVTYEDISHNENANANAGQQTYTRNPQPAQASFGFKPLKTDRSLVIYILLSIVTCGIYSIIWVYELINDMNTVCAGDGDETPGLVKYILLTIVTCGIYSWIWWYKLGNRMQLNAPRYGLQFAENGTTILLWMLVGVLLCGVGPYIAMYYVIKNMNALCMEYNRYNGAC